MMADNLTLSAPGVIVGVFVESLRPPGSMSTGPGAVERGRNDSFKALVEELVVEAGTHAATAFMPAGQASGCWLATSLALRGL